MGMELSAPLVGVGILQAVLYVLFVRFVDLYEREPLMYVLPVFVWGFTVAVVVSLVFNTLFSLTISAVASAQAATFLTSVVGAPVIEESAKGLALLITFGVAYGVSRRRGAIEFSGVMDGIVYGSAVGFGFAIAEDLLYYAQFGPETFVVRRVFGGFAHAAFASLTGIGIGLIPWVRHGISKFTVPLLGLAGAIGLHALFNLTATLFGPLAYGVMLIVVLLYVALIVVWLAAERRIIRSELRDEVGDETISQGDYELLPTYFRRKSYYLGLILGGRFSEWRAARSAHSTAVDLAFTKRLSRNSRAAPQSIRERRLRQKLRDTRNAPAAKPAS
ncbi:MAG: PrsW family intramembrane metalloprotease [Rubrobacteraceae bacterium]